MPADLMHKGKSESLIYSLSRWTDLPLGKWSWFKNCLANGWMLGVDPRTGVISKWSLKIEDVLGLVFWTKNPSNLIEDFSFIREYPLVVHLTLTGWTEVEHGAPNIKWGLSLLEKTVKTFGGDRVEWRFSPIPLLRDSEIIERFRKIAKVAELLELKRVYVSFLNYFEDSGYSKDFVSARSAALSEQATISDRNKLIYRLQNETQLQLIVCQDNYGTVQSGVCEDGSRFLREPSKGAIPIEKCGCALAVDPFTLNETCPMACEYCYARTK